MKPTIGRIVHYRSRTGNYTVPAIIAATQDTLHRPNVEAGYIPDLDSETHVHLVCFTPGSPGKRTDAPDFIGERADAPVGESRAGTYQEWNVPLGAADQPGTWFWPERV